MKKNKYIAFLLILSGFVFADSLDAQVSPAKGDKVSTFSGKVTRSDLKEGVSGVKLLLMDKKKSDDNDNSVQAVTGQDGSFEIAGIKPGEYTLSIRAIFDREEDVPCQLLMGKIDEPNSKVLVLTEGDKKVEQIFIEGFKVKAGKNIKKNFDLVCKSLFSE